MAEVHDCFTIAELMMYEAVGFAEPGKGIDLLRSGDTSLEGSVPVNPGGGLVGFGHPVGATGVKQAAEVYRQMKGLCGDYQIQEGHPHRPDRQHGRRRPHGGFAGAGKRRLIPTPATSPKGGRPSPAPFSYEVMLRDCLRLIGGGNHGPPFKPRGRHSREGGSPEPAPDPVPGAGQALIRGRVSLFSSGPAPRHRCKTGWCNRTTIASSSQIWAWLMIPSPDPAPGHLPPPYRGGPCARPVQVSAADNGCLTG